MTAATKPPQVEPSSYWGRFFFPSQSPYGFRTGIREEQLRDAPAFSDDSWTDRDWETRTQHYGTPPYWGT